MLSEEARQQAQAEGLTLRLADNKSGYFGVYHHTIGKAKPYQARVSSGGRRDMHLGYFVTAEEAALCVARAPEGKVTNPNPNPNPSPNPNPNPKVALLRASLSP